MQQSNFLRFKTQYFLNRCNYKVLLLQKELQNILILNGLFFSDKCNEKKHNEGRYTPGQAPAS